MTVQPKLPTICFGARRGPRTVTADHAHLDGRTPVASFARYADAERTLELLAHASFPVHRVALVGGDLKLAGATEAGITGARTAALGGCGGLWVGAMMALFTVVNGPNAGGLLVRLSWELPLGALSGVAVGLSAYAMLGDARGPVPRWRLVATRHELHVDTEIAASAWRLLVKLHPSGMMPVDRVPAEVVAQPTEVVLIETFDTAPSPAAQPPSPHAGRPAAAGAADQHSGRYEPEDAANQQAGRPEPAPAARHGARPVDLPAGAA